MFDRLAEAISSSARTYLVVLAVCAADAVLPVLPGETVLITGGVLAGAGDLYSAVTPRTVPGAPESTGDSGDG